MRIQHCCLLHCRSDDEKALIRIVFISTMYRKKVNRFWTNLLQQTTFQKRVSISGSPLVNYMKSTFSQRKWT